MFIPEADELQVVYVNCQRKATTLIIKLPLNTSKVVTAWPAGLVPDSVI